MRHAKAMLFVHNHQPKIVKDNIVLKQRVRANSKADAPIGNRGAGLIFVTLFQAA